MRHWFLGNDTKVITKEKNKLDFMKINHFSTSNDTTKKVKRQLTERKKNLCIIELVTSVGNWSLTLLVSSEWLNRTVHPKDCSEKHLSIASRISLGSPLVNSRVNSLPFQGLKCQIPQHKESRQVREVVPSA